MSLEFPRRCAAWTILLLGALTLGAAAKDRPRGLAKLEPARRMEMARELVRRLATTPEERQRMLGFCAEAQGLLERARAEARDIQAEQREAFAAFRREVARNLGLSPEVERRTARAKQRGQDAHKRYCDELARIEARFVLALRPEQAQVLDRLAPRRPEQPLHRELRDIAEEKHGAIGPIGWLLLAPEFHAALGGQGLPAAACVPIADPMVEGLRQDIVLWNLINGLNLTEAQLGKLIPLAEDAGAPQAARSVLTPAQTEILVNFKPCLIPTADLRDPVRVGQAGDSGHVVRHLERLREIPEARWAARRGEVVERVLAGLEQHGGRYPEAEREHARQKLMAFLARVRAMDELDFELEQSALAAEFKAFAREQALQAELDRLTDRDQKARQRAGHFLLSPRAAVLYRERLQALRRPENLGKTDLKKVAAAPNCKDRGCALED